MQSKKQVLSPPGKATLADVVQFSMWSWNSPAQALHQQQGGWMCQDFHHIPALLAGGLDDRAHGQKADGAREAGYAMTRLESAQRLPTPIFTSC